MISLADKPAIRSRMLKLRRQAAAAMPDAGRAAAEAFPDHWLPGAGAVVAGYWPLAGEIDPRPLMDRLAGLGAKLCLPVVQGHGQALVFKAYTRGDPLDVGGMGVSEPSAKQAVCRPGLLLVPMLACDRNGNRVGFGKGYYDYTLAELRRAGDVRAIGLAFNCQMVAELPAQRHDEPLDGLVTESAAYAFGDGDGSLGSRQPQR